MELTRTGVSKQDLRAVWNVDTEENTTDIDRSDRKRVAYVYLKQHFNITKFILKSGIIQHIREVF